MHISKIQPWVVEQDDIKIMENLLLFVDFYRDSSREQLRILEWGAGHSTVYYPNFLRSYGVPYYWIAIEHTEKWYQILHGLKIRYGLNNVQVAFRELTPEDFKKDAGNTNHKYFYVNAATAIAPNKKYDVIYIDGRLRNRCLKASVNLLSKDGRIIFDNVNRKHYHKYLHLFDGEFVKPHLWIGQLK